jgi:FAD/FMN-containing dehydrogenase
MADISRRRFLNRGLSGATIVAGFGLTGLAKAAADEKSDGSMPSGAGSASTRNRNNYNGNVDPNANPNPNANSANEPDVSPDAGTNGMDSANPPATAVLEPPSIEGEVVLAGAPQFDESRKNYNGRFNIEPKCILYCKNENDVIKAVKWAKAQKLNVSIRSGGHSYEAFSLIQDGVVIDLSRMTSVKVDLASKTATVAAGTTLIPLYEALWQKGVVVPGGSCATVGVGGSTLGGGFGLLSRHMGLTCDNLKALRMVDANGELIIADANNHSDLLWACRGGGGGNFGVVTQFTFRVHPIGNVSVIKMRWNWQDMKPVIKAWQKLAPNADERLGSVLTMSSKAAGSLLFLGIFVGAPATARALIEPLLSAAKPLRESIEVCSFIEAARRFSGFKKPTTPLTANALPDTVHMHVHPRFKNTSDYVNAELSDEAIDTIIKYLSESPIKSSCVQFDGYGGAIARIPEKDSAFCHRAGTKFCMHYQVSWGRASDDNLGISWVESFRGAMQPFVSGFSYANYCDLTMDDWAHRYYGANLDRLNSIKTKYDPDGFFSFAQSLGVAKAK